MVVFCIDIYDVKTSKSSCLPKVGSNVKNKQRGMQFVGKNWIDWEVNN